MSSPRYSLNTPKNSKQSSGYFILLEKMFNGQQIPYSINYNYSIQALREAGLCKSENRKGYVITPKGMAYVSYVNSSNKPLKRVLDAIIMAA